MASLFRRLFPKTHKLYLIPGKFSQEIHDRNYIQIYEWCVNNLSEDQYDFTYGDQSPQRRVRILTPSYVVLKNVPQEDIVFLKLKFGL